MSSGRAMARTPVPSDQMTSLRHAVRNTTTRQAFFNNLPAHLSKRSESMNQSLAAMKRWRIQIFAITWLAYAAFYFTRKAFSVAKLGIG